MSESIRIDWDAPVLPKNQRPRIAPKKSPFRQMDESDLPTSTLALIPEGYGLFVARDPGDSCRMSWWLRPLNPTVHQCHVRYVFDMFERINYREGTDAFHYMILDMLVQKLRQAVGE